MAEVVTDERVAAVLRPFVRATAPVLEVLRESDPLGLRGRFRSERGRPVAFGAGAESGPGWEGTSDPVGNTTRVQDAEQTGKAKQAGIETPRSTEGSGGPGNDCPGADTRLTGETVAGAGEPAEGDIPAGEAARASALEKIRNQLDGMQLPGSSAWDAMDLDQRCDWWSGRVGRFLALMAGLSRFGGVLTSRLPIRNALGMAGQGLVLSAIAAEHGMTDRSAQVRLIAKVLLDRDLSPEVASGEVGGSRRAEDARTGELTREMEASARKHGRPKPKVVARTVWRMARTLWEIDSELDKRPQGRFYHEMLGSVPLVGVVGGYMGERSALRRVARRGSRWIRRHY